MAFDITSWGADTSLKESCPKIIENFRALKDDGNINPTFTGTVTLPKTNMTGAINETIVTMASASTMAIGAAAGNYIAVTGTTNITAFDTVQAGTKRTLRFTSALTLIHSTSLSLPTSDNITVSPADVMEFISLGSGVWICSSYQPKVGYSKNGFGLGEGSLKFLTNVDLNTVIIGGKYWVYTGCTNTPGNYGVLEVSMAGATDGTQELSLYTGNKFYRTCSGGTWSEWEQVATKDSFDYSTEITNVDWNNVNKNGKYYMIGSSASTLNAPIPWGATCLFYLDVTNGTSTRYTTYVKQTATSIVTGLTFTRKCQAGTWSPWKQIANSDSEYLLVDRVYAPANWNGIVTPGVYLVTPETPTGQSNTAPLATGIYSYGQLVVTSAGNNTSIQQTYYSHTGNIAIRQSFNGGSSWTTWRQLSYADATFVKVTDITNRDLNSFTGVDKYWHFDTGSGAVLNTPFGTLANGSGQVGTVRNVGIYPGRMIQYFDRYYPQTVVSLWFRTYNSDGGGVWSAWRQIISCASGGQTSLTASGATILGLSGNSSATGVVDFEINRTSSALPVGSAPGIMLKDISTGFGSLLQSASGQLQFFQVNSSNPSAWVEAMRIDSANASYVRGVYPFADNAYTCGKAGSRWSAVWNATNAVTTSDGRAKTAIAESALGLDFINKLRPVSYKYKIGGNVVTQEEDGTETKVVEATYDEEGNILTEATTEEIPKYKEVVTPVEGKRVHYGMIAQEVKEVLNDTDFGGYVYDPETDSYGLRYEEFVSPLIKAVQELTAKVAELEKRLEENNETKVG